MGTSQHVYFNDSYVTPQHIILSYVVPCYFAIIIKYAAGSIKYITVCIFVVINRHATCNLTSNNNNNNTVLLYCIVLITWQGTHFFPPNYLTKSMACLAVPYFSLFRKRRDFREKIFLLWSVLIFSTTFILNFSYYILIARRIQLDIVIKVLTVSCMAPNIIVHF